MPAKGTAFSVDLLIVTPDQKRKIDFKLSKGFKNDGSVDWNLEFGLQERSKLTDPFHDLVKLKVNIQPALHQKAQATANNGLDDSQTSAAFAAADSAKLLSAGEISKASANAAARRVISVRGA
ncbi:MAG TPA: hypothetical protein VN643_09665 [Pyrinomonadaceae bacterium]|nr:hypothetical protein [Pyrinomonadaceae bacterium]